jgi:hypothetical protein
MGLCGQSHAPTALPRKEARYPFCRRLGGPQGRAGRVQKISPKPGVDPRIVQLVASRYTDCAIRSTVSHYSWFLHIIREPSGKDKRLFFKHS